MPCPRSQRCLQPSALTLYAVSCLQPSGLVQRPLPCLQPTGHTQTASLALPAANCTYSASCALPAEILQDLLGLLHRLRKYNQMSGLTASSLGAAMGPLLFRPQHSDRAQSSEDIHSWVASAVSAVQGTALNGAQWRRGWHSCLPAALAKAKGLQQKHVADANSCYVLALTPRGI